MSRPEPVASDPDAPSTATRAALDLVADLSAGAGFVRAIGRTVTGTADRTDETASTAPDGSGGDETETRCPYCGKRRQKAAEWRADDRADACAGCAATMARKEAAWRSGKPLP